MVAQELVQSRWTFYGHRINSEKKKTPALFCWSFFVLFFRPGWPPRLPGAPRPQFIPEHGAPVGPRSASRSLALSRVRTEIQAVDPKGPET